MASGLYTSVPPILVWLRCVPVSIPCSAREILMTIDLLSNNSAPHYKRATAAGLQLAIANAGGFVAAFVRPPPSLLHPLLTLVPYFRSTPLHKDPTTCKATP